MWHYNSKLRTAFALAVVIPIAVVAVPVQLLLEILAGMLPYRVKLWLPKTLW